MNSRITTHTTTSENGAPPSITAPTTHTSPSDPRRSRRVRQASRRAREALECGAPACKKRKASAAGLDDPTKEEPRPSPRQEQKKLKSSPDQGEKKPEPAPAPRRRKSMGQPSESMQMMLEVDRLYSEMDAHLLLLEALGGKPEEDYGVISWWFGKEEVGRDGRKKRKFLWWAERRPW